jgi:hypothetical protein
VLALCEKRGVPSNTSIMEPTSRLSWAIEQSTPPFATYAVQIRKVPLAPILMRPALVKGTFDRTINLKIGELTRTKSEDKL